MTNGRHHNCHVKTTATTTSMMGQMTAQGPPSSYAAATASATYNGVFYAYIHNVCTHHDLITGYSLTAAYSR